MNHVVYIKNRIPQNGIQCSPFEVLTGNQPTLKHVRVFGCATFIYEHGPKSKVHARASPAIMLGCNEHGVYTVEKLLDKKVVNSDHVTFDENSFPYLDVSDSSSSGEDEEYYVSSETSMETSTEAFDMESDEEVTDIRPPEDKLEDVTPTLNDSQLRRSGRFRNQPNRLTCAANHHARSVISFPITTANDPSVYEAMNATKDEVEMWRNAIKTELITLENKGS